MPTLSMLLVDDDTNSLEILAAIFAKKFPDLVLNTAPNGKAGLELFKIHMPEIVITDINMPEMNGMQLAGNIRKIKPDTKIIALTGSVKEHVLQDSVKKGLEFDYFFSKPVAFQKLSAAVRQCIFEIEQRESSPLRSVVSY